VKQCHFEGFASFLPAATHGSVPQRLNSFINSTIEQQAQCNKHWVPGYRSWGPGFDSRLYQIFWEVLGLERGPLSLVGIIEELLEWKSSGSGLENRINGRRDPLRWPCDKLYPQKLALTSPACGRRSVGIVCLRTKGHGVFFVGGGYIMTQSGSRNTASDERMTDELEKIGRKL
jgi:hypothetical protein